MSIWLSSCSSSSSEQVGGEGREARGALARAGGVAHNAMEWGVAHGGVAHNAMEEKLDLEVSQVCK